MVRWALGLLLLCGCGGPAQAPRARFEESPAAPLGSARTEGCSFCADDFGCDEGDRCYALSDAPFGTCVSPCPSSGACPDGFTCASAPSASGAMGAFCLPRADVCAEALGAHP